MKIICIGRNYIEHIKELGNKMEKEPIIFTKPDTALLRNNEDFYYPYFSKNIHHEIEIVIKISKNGKTIPLDFAHRYYDEIALGIDFTARDLQEKAKEQGLPWVLSKGFDQSAPIGDFIPIKTFKNLKKIDFCLKINDKIKQKGNTKDMIWDFDELITYISKFILLKKGDLIFTGTPKGVSPIHAGDIIQGFIGKTKYLDFEVK